MTGLAGDKPLVGDDVGQPLVGVRNGFHRCRGRRLHGAHAAGGEEADATAGNEEDDCSRKSLWADRRKFEGGPRNARCNRSLWWLRALDRPHEGEGNRLPENVVEAVLSEVGAVSQLVVEPLGTLVGGQALLKLMLLFGRRLAIQQGG